MARTRRNRWWTDDDRDGGQYGRSRRSLRRERRAEKKSERLATRAETRRRAQEAMRSA